jgi:N-terminal half of MaoC dehydratase
LHGPTERERAAADRSAVGCPELGVYPGAPTAEQEQENTMASQPTSAAPDSSHVELDLSDVDHRVGKPIGGGQLWDPCSSSDIRRWVMAMDYPNPLHWDERFARDSAFGGIVAPQSIAVALDYGHGAAPACVGHIPKSHLIFGGEEWWFYGCPVRPGDQLFQQRRQGGGNEIRWAYHVFAGGHDSQESKWCPGGA